MQKRHLLSLVTILLTLSAFVFNASAQPTREYSTPGEFEDVRADVEDAIVNKGLVIEYVGKIAAMLARTAESVGNPEAIYKEANYFTFCSAPLTHKSVAAHAKNIGICPYSIYVYELIKQPGKVYVGYRRPLADGSPASRKALGAIDKLLDEIVKDAISE